MKEEEAREWVTANFGERAAESLDSYVALLLAGSATQNLISENSKAYIWSRHIVDSAQLVRYGPRNGTWTDIGSGAGLPGIVVALCTDLSVTLVEPRQLRTNFLARVIDDLGLGGRVSVQQVKAQNYSAIPAAAISARAVASLDKIFQSALHISNTATHWILPKGSGAELEVENARKSWHGVFHVKPSITDPASGIVIAQGVRRR